MRLPPALWAIQPELTEAPGLWRGVEQAFIGPRKNDGLALDVVGNIANAGAGFLISEGSLGHAYEGGGSTFLGSAAHERSRNDMNATGFTFAGVVETKTTIPVAWSNIHDIGFNGNEGLVRWHDSEGAGERQLGALIWSGSGAAAYVPANAHDQKPHPYVVSFDLPNSEMTLWTDQGKVGPIFQDIPSGTSQLPIRIFDRFDTNSLLYMTLFAMRPWSKTEALRFIADPFEMLRRAEDVPMHAFAAAGGGDFPVPLLAPRQNTLLRM